MKKVLIFGNSGSGKSTFAKKLRQSDDLAHLDLDTLAWQDTLPPERKPLIESKQELLTFIQSNESWVIDGGYVDLLEMAASYANEIIFLNLPVDDCIANAKNRPWEPHKYDSKQEQDANLEMLIGWIADYYKRQDPFSSFAHTVFYNKFLGKKMMFTQNSRAYLEEMTNV
jgi:adenylate kinase family enzyme